MTKKPFFLKAIVLLLFFSFPAAAQETLPSDKTTVETQSDDVPAETAETTDGRRKLFRVIKRQSKRSRTTYRRKRLKQQTDSRLPLRIRRKMPPPLPRLLRRQPTELKTRRKVGNPIMKKFSVGEWTIRFLRH